MHPEDNIQKLVLKRKNPTYLAARNELAEGPPGMSTTFSHTSKGNEVEFCLRFFFLDGLADGVVPGRVKTCKFAVVATMSCSIVLDTMQSNVS